MKKSGAFLASYERGANQHCLCCDVTDMTNLTHIQNYCRNINYTENEFNQYIYIQDRYHTVFVFQLVFFETNRDMKCFTLYLQDVTEMT